MEKKVFVLTSQEKMGDSEEVTLTVEGVFATKTAAKERLRKRRAEIIGFFEETFLSDFAISFDDPILFSITACSSCVWNELLITEKKII